MNNSSEIKKFNDYFPESIKFYKLKNEGLARIIFVLVLFCQLVGGYVQYKYLNILPVEEISRIYSALTSAMESAAAGAESYPAELTQSAAQILSIFTVILVTSLLAKLISNLFLSVYMYSYISEKKGKETGYLACFKGTFRHMGRLIGYNIIFGLIIMIGLMFFIIPGIIAYVIFIFGYCYILDLKLNLLDAMTASSENTKGKKAQIAGIFLGFYFIIKLPVFLLFSGSSLGMVLLAAFFSTIADLMLQRLITQIYLDLEYKKNLTAK